MNATTLRRHLERLDEALDQPAKLCVYGSAALMLQGEEDRFSADMDIAGPYSVADERKLAMAARNVGFPVNPPPEFSGDHIEWVGPLRLCLPSPVPENVVTLWQGSQLTLFTLPPADLIASRLIRYDPTDQADIQFLLIQGHTSPEEIAAAVERLPRTFRADALVRENLENLRHDFKRWVP